MYRALTRRYPLAASAFVLLGVLAGVASADPRDDYLAAQAALRSGDQATYATLAQGLRNYPLYPYLRYEELTRNPSSASDSDIESFLAQYGDTPLAERLGASYLTRLAAAGRWTDYLRVYRQDESTERRCLYLRALLATGQRDRALSDAELEPIWLSADSQPDACDPLFAAWTDAGGLTPARVWARIRLAMDAGKTGLARWLKDKLPESERPRLDLWLGLRSNPERILDPGLLPGTHPMDPAILATGIARLAAKDPVDADDALTRLDPRLEPDPAARDRAIRAVARALAGSDDDTDCGRGLERWDSMSATIDNQSAQEERLRAAARLGAWQRVAEWIARMPDSDEKADRWLYWLARAQEALGQDEQAQATYRQAAQRRSLWGFLAADRVGLPYKLDKRPTPALPERVQAIAGSPALARIGELRLLGREADMRREWRTLTRNLDTPGLMAAASVADSLGWHDQAIFTLARTGWWDDLDLRFPLTYRDLVSEQAWQTALPEDWIFAVIRQESVFAPTVASSAGALGLMQLMPATARRLASDPWLDLWIDGAGDGLGRSEILRPETNIALGSAYLAAMRDRFGHPALATAAYNAGPRRVQRWLPDGCMEADRWILSIPFDETRGYVERVLAYRAIYAARLGAEPVRLSSMLPPVAARADSQEGPSLAKTESGSDPRR